MEQAVRSWRPHLILREPCEYASAVVALNSGVTQATVAISQGRVEASALRLAGPTLDRRRAGTAAALTQAPYLSRFPSSLDRDHVPDTRRYRIAEDGRRPLPSWWGNDTRPLIYLTLGTVAPRVTPQAVPTFEAMAKAVSQLPVRGLLTVADGPYRLPDVTTSNLQPSRGSVRPPGGGDARSGGGGVSWRVRNCPGSPRCRRPPHRASDDGRPAGERDDGGESGCWSGAGAARIGCGGAEQSCVDTFSGGAVASRAGVPGRGSKDRLRDAPGAAPRGPGPDLARRSRRRVAWPI